MGVCRSASRGSFGAAAALFGKAFVKRRAIDASRLIEAGFCRSRALSANGVWSGAVVGSPRGLGSCRVGAGFLWEPSPLGDGALIGAVVCSPRGLGSYRWGAGSTDVRLVRAG